MKGVFGITRCVNQRSPDKLNQWNTYIYIYMCIYIYIGIPHFIALSLIMLCKYCVFNKIEGPWPPCIPQVYQYHFSSNICSLCISVFSSAQSLNGVRLFATPWIAARQASLSITNSQSLLKLMSIESVMPSSHLILCRPLLLLPTIPPSISLFST